jgi:ethanolamine-phosphate cytidylyltransferase
VLLPESPLPLPLASHPAVTDVPYDLSPEFVEELFTKHKIDYIIHGDDPCLLPDGTDAYAHAKKLGRFKMVSAQGT